LVSHDENAVKLKYRTNQENSCNEVWQRWSRPKIWPNFCTRRDLRAFQSKKVVHPPCPTSFKQQRST
jgi:hypothetical protein